MAADSAVSFVVNKLSNLLIEEASLLVGVKGVVEWLRDQLGWMKSFLKDAYTNRRRDERAKHWERAVRDTAYRVEDIIDSYMIEIISRRQQPLRCCGILKPGERYFIVLDDIWTTGVWHLIEAILPDDNNSSRVLLTTRSGEVARFANPSIEPYQLPYLNVKESWELFLKKAFPMTHEAVPECPRGLEDIAGRLVNKCGGLPLAILVLGGLISSKKMTPKAWMKVDERMDWASPQDGQQCLKILALSYDDIPNPNMRSCFLYMGVFPEDSLIQASQLITLWIAQGFIPQLPNHTMEDTAVDYLDQLVQRSMIEVVERDYDGSIMLCGVHDLLRDLCLREAREDGFLHVCRGSTDLGTKGIEHHPVRLAFHYLDKVEGFCPGPDLRSLSINGASEVTREMFQGWTNLRVMHLEYVGESGLNSLLAKKAANRLRYLGLTYCSWLSKLPPSFGDIFTNLQMLDLRGTGVTQLPQSLRKIKTLRHLYTPGSCKLPPNISNLTKLQTIDAVDARGGWVEQSLAMLSNIQTLSIGELHDTLQKDFANALRKLERLSSLRIWISRTVTAEYIRALSNHNSLYKLYLQGAMPQGELPESHDFPRNLTVLELEETKLKKDPMPTLERLPNLVSLLIGRDSYSEKEMTCTAGGLLRLEKLVLSMLFHLERWDVEDRAMPNLVSLILESCDKLIRLPEDLPNLKKLQNVAMIVSPDFKSRLQEGVGEDWWKIKHVKSVTYR